jgi:hypothetical protein
MGGASNPINGPRDVTSLVPVSCSLVTCGPISTHETALKAPGRGDVPFARSPSPSRPPLVAAILAWATLRRIWVRRARTVDWCEWRRFEAPAVLRNDPQRIAAECMHMYTKSDKITFQEKLNVGG